jgi:DNA-binding transcriptional regulator GbsR (MarR family)
MNSSPSSGPGAESSQIQAWVERVGTWCMEQAGWPPIMGRTLAWLMVSDPPEQTAAQIAEAVHASRASLTGALRLLIEAHMVQAVTYSRDRSRYYRLTPDAWNTLLQRRMESITSFLELAQEGVGLFPEGAPRADRVREAQRMFEWLRLETAPLLKMWNASRDERPSGTSRNTPFPIPEHDDKRRGDDRE